MVNRKVNPAKKIKNICQVIKDDFVSSFSKREKEEFRHIGELFLGGLFVGGAMLAYHFYGLSTGKRNGGVHFFDHLTSSIDPSFIHGGFLLTGALLFLSGWVLEAVVYRLLVTPWLRMATHGLAVLAGAMLPIGIGAGMEVGGIAGGLFSGFVLSLLLTLGALVVGSVRLGANPSLRKDDAGLIESIFVIKWLRMVLGIGLILIALFVK